MFELKTFHFDEKKKEKETTHSDLKNYFLG